MRSSLSDPDSPSTLNFQGVTVSPILTERAECDLESELAILGQVCVKVSMRG